MSERFRRTRAEINLDHILYNYSAIRGLMKKNCKFMAVVKADAYGHGVPIVSRVLSDCGVDYFGVSGLDEAIQLRNEGITNRILILGYTPAEWTDEILTTDAVQTVFSLEYAKSLSKQAQIHRKKLKVHIKVDTGMSRLGFVTFGGDDRICRVIEEIREVCTLPHLIIEGIYTHFAVSDDVTSSFTREQYDRFCKLIHELERIDITFPIRHSCNSAATINYPDMHMDMVRPGLILYGLYPSEVCYDKIHIKPVMEFKTVISQIKDIAKGATVSYGRTYTADRDMCVAVLPVGYADGFLRKLSNNVDVLINGQRAKQIGKICMDQCVVDITGFGSVSEGESVTIFGKDLDEAISVEELARIMNTINFEVVCLIGKRVPRIYLKNGKEVNIFNYIL